MPTSSNRDRPALVLTTHGEEEALLLLLWRRLSPSAHQAFLDGMRIAVTANGRESSPDQSPGTPVAPPDAWRDTS